jgi:hypothetical protein
MRTTADKRCAVAIALREYPNLSDEGIAELCGVSRPFVLQLRRALTPTGCNDYTLRTGRDGKQYPAHPKAAPHTTGTGSVEEGGVGLGSRWAGRCAPSRLRRVSNFGISEVPSSLHRMAAMDLEERMP